MGTGTQSERSGLPGVMSSRARKHSSPLKSRPGTDSRIVICSGKTCSPYTEVEVMRFMEDEVT